MIDAAMATLIGQERDGFPRSQFYKALRGARAAGGLIGAKSDAAVQEWRESYAKRAGGKAALRLLKENPLPLCSGAEPRPAALELALIAQLWDYARPFGSAALAPAFERGARA